MAQTTTVTLMPALPAPAGSPISILGEKQQAAAYYIAGRELQTITWSFQNSFNGVVKVQASLATTPGIFDWFDVYTIPVNAATSGPPQAGFYNLLGSYVWLRVNISAWSAGYITLVAASY